MTNKREIIIATRRRIREIINEELSEENLLYLVCRKSIDSDTGKVLVSGFDPNWDVVQKEVKSVYRKLFRKK